MSVRRELGIDRVDIDLGRLVERSVASLYSHLVTRPTGRAVRTAIESQLAERGEGRALSLIDFSEVRVLDFSCADEVVAKLILRFMDDEGEWAFFVFQGVGDQHRDPIEAVLERHGLATVAETRPGRFELLGSRTPRMEKVWRVLESRGRVGPDEVDQAFPDPDDREVLRVLARRRLLFHRPVPGDYHALSTLVRDLL